jgi:hypothetical protein
MGIVFPILIVLGVLAGLGFGLARTRGRRFTRA